ncbi:MAG: J domain-containing protein [Chitinophagales bacterium]
MRFNKNLTIVLIKTTEGKVIFKPFGYHKLILAIFGLLLDGARGFIAGFIIGCFFDGKFIPKQAPPKTPDIRLSFLMLGAFILQVTGIELKLSPENIRSRLVNQFGESYVEKRYSFFRELLQQRIQVAAICEQLNAIADPKEKVNLIKFLYALSYSPVININKLNERLFYLAENLHIDSDVVKQLAAQYSSQKKAYATDPIQPNASSSKQKSIYSVFGLNSDCTEKQLKKAYHDLAKKYHPDTNPLLSHIEKLKLQEKLRSVIIAYEEIKELKGWK